ncbi:hypothetical protein ILUMI_16879, partial [Ignelater luminosus]
FLVNFEIYQGKSTPVINPEYDRVFGMVTAPMNFFLDELPDDKKRIGTIRKNRIPKDCILPSHEQMKKMKRGTFRGAIEKRDGIFIGKWMDNSVVTVASNSLGENSVKSVKRFSSKEKNHINVLQPAVIGIYNKSMGGTNRMDQDIN